MKLKAPPGVGDPCVGGVVLVAQDGGYEVDAATAALLIECFGFVAVEMRDTPRPAFTPPPTLAPGAAPAAPAETGAVPPRRRRAGPRKAQ